MENTTSNLAVVIEKLAAKLGTTAEYLWGVLIKQAAVNALNNVIFIVFVILFGFILFRLHKKFLKEDKNNDSIYDEFEGAAIIPMVLGCVAFLVMFFCGIACIGDTITSLVNPEYWALQQILTQVN